MKKIFRYLGALFGGCAVLLLAGVVLEVEVWDKVLWLVVVLTAAALMKPNRQKDEERTRELHEKFYTEPIGFVRYSTRMRHGLMICLLLSVVLLVVVILAVMEYTPKGEDVFWVLACLAVIVIAAAFLAFGLSLTSMEIAYSGKYVVVKRGKKEHTIAWSEFGVHKVGRGLAKFYDRSGAKLFSVDKTLPGFADFFVFYEQMIQ